MQKQQQKSLGYTSPYAKILCQMPTGLKADKWKICEYLTAKHAYISHFFTDEMNIDMWPDNHDSERNLNAKKN
jgi:hypothetical protein